MHKLFQVNGKSSITNGTHYLECRNNFLFLLTCQPDFIYDVEKKICVLDETPKEIEEYRIHLKSNSATVDETCVKHKIVPMINIYMNLVLELCFSRNLELSLYFSIYRRPMETGIHLQQAKIILRHLNDA